MIKYTFILEYDGGTYIKQIIAISLRNALSIWADEIGPEIPKFGKRKKSKLLIDIEHDDPVLLNGLENVWYMGLSTGKKRGLLNIVATL